MPNDILDHNELSSDILVTRTTLRLQWHGLHFLFINLLYLSAYGVICMTNNDIILSVLLFVVMAGSACLTSYCYYKGLRWHGLLATLIGFILFILCFSVVLSRIDNNIEAYIPFIQNHFPSLEKHEDAKDFLEFVLISIPYSVLVSLGIEIVFISTLLLGWIQPKWKDIFYRQE